MPDIEDNRLPLRAPLEVLRISVIFGFIILALLGGMATYLLQKEFLEVKSTVSINSKEIQILRSSSIDQNNYTPNRIQYIKRGTYFDSSAGVCKHFVSRGNGNVAGVSVSHYDTNGITPNGTFACPNTDLSIFIGCPPKGNAVRLHFLFLLTIGKCFCLSGLFHV